MNAFDVLGDPVRRRILEILADGESGAGAITSSIRGEFGISQPAVSQHLRVLREERFVTVRASGPHRFYTGEPGRLAEAEAWFARFHQAWASPFAALGTEIARGQRERRLAVDRTPDRKDAS
jgi:DNA-binding transcriptional ArsR family regulator